MERRLLVVEDDPRIRTLLGTLLCPTGWVPILAGTGAEALAHVRGDLPIAVALMDLGLPDVDGVDLIAAITADRPDLPIVVLTVCTQERKILDAFRAGARGYLFKEDLGKGLSAALGEALAGGAPMSRAVARLVLEQLRPDATAPNPPPAPKAALTDRERQVIEQLARGLSYGEVGTVLQISANTVRSYIRTIYEKLAVGSKTEAVLAALRLGLVSAADAGGPFG